MVTSKDIDLIINAVCKGEKLFDTLRENHLSPMHFFKYLNEHPETKLKFELARQIVAEQGLEDCIHGIDDILTDLELKKHTLKVRTHQWVAEKLIPQTYGPRVDINVHKTIDIVGVLREADKRVFIESDVVHVIDHDTHVDSSDATPRLTPADILGD